MILSLNWQRTAALVAGLSLLACEASFAADDTIPTVKIAPIQQPHTVPPPTEPKNNEIAAPFQPPPPSAQITNTVPPPFKVPRPGQPYEPPASSSSASKPQTDAWSAGVTNRSSPAAPTWGVDPKTPSGWSQPAAPSRGKPASSSPWDAPASR